MGEQKLPQAILLAPLCLAILFSPLWRPLLMHCFTSLALPLCCSFLLIPKKNLAFFSHSLFKEAFKGLQYCSHSVLEGDVQSVFINWAFWPVVLPLRGPKGRKLGSFLTLLFQFLWNPEDVIWGPWCFDRMNGVDVKAYVERDSASFQKALSAATFQRSLKIVWLGIDFCRGNYTNLTFN